MLYKIENYLIDVEDIRDLSIWYKVDDTYHSFSRDDIFTCETEDDWFCLLIDFKHMASDDDYEEIKLYMKNSDEAYQYFDSIVNELMALTNNQANFPEPKFCTNEENKSLFN